MLRISKVSALDLIELILSLLPISTSELICDRRQCLELKWKFDGLLLRLLYDVVIKLQPEIGVIDHYTTIQFSAAVPMTVEKYAKLP